MSPSKSKGIIIELDNPYRSYFAGQVIQGRVIVQNDKPKKTKELTLLLEGSGRVRWSETHTTYVNTGRQGQRKSQPKNVWYNATETYVQQKIQLVGDGHNFITLPEGTTTYPFQLILPSTLPSSFTSKIGLVSYFLEAEMRRPLLKPNKKMALPITVNALVDLNLEQRAMLTQEIKRVKGSNFFACRKGQLGFELRLKRSGYVSGEALDFSCEITNSSSTKVNHVKAMLVQNIIFYAQGRSRSQRKNVFELKGPAIECGDHEMWCPTSLAIPPLPPTRLGVSCHIIDVQYFLQVEMSIAGLSTSLSGELPIMIGTIPLRTTFEQLRPLPIHLPPQQPQPMSSQVPYAVPGTSTASYPPISPTDKSQYFQDTILDEPRNAPPSAPFLTEYPDLPPPTYAEAVLTESFTWNPEGNDETDQTDGGNLEKQREVDMNASSNVPTAPPMYEFVPNYITYGKV
ncbi:Arrestin domain-containing protein 3 [Orchesella cincta]|uniref:Arrestin domain-containing protein 3 n=1 Tax=Orchesella cincta TaxID=48709 RepID=A0A1D2MJB3_ORCCI|nr:Arrestin domain-containing protein 3 [Orchesella cincta]